MKAQKYLLLLVSILLYAAQFKNLICEGGFQSFNTSITVPAMDGLSYIKYSMYDSNYTCWYRKPPGRIQIQTQSYGYNTKNVELSDDLFKAYSLCQNLTLTINMDYFISIQFASPKQVVSSSAFVYMNGIALMNGTNSNYLRPVKIATQFRALSINNELCINGSAKKSSIFIIGDYTPLIDNVTVQPMLLNETVNISSIFNSSTPSSGPDSNISSVTAPTQLLVVIRFNMITNDQQGYIQFTSQDALSQQIFNIFNTQTVFYIEGQLQKNVVSMQKIDGTFFTRIYVERSYNLKQIEISVPKYYLDNAFIVNMLVFINGRPIFVFFKPESSIKAVKNIQPYSEAILTGVLNIYTILRACFCSYFLVNAINFYSLTLMYNFLALPVQPTFSHNGLQKIARLFYVRNSLSNFMKNLTNNSNFHIIANIFQVYMTSSQNQRIDKFYRDYSWFGDIGTSNDFLINNLENLVLICFSFLKLLFIKIIYKIFPNFMSRHFGRFQHFSYFMIIQLICISPMITVSAFQNFLQLGYLQTSWKFNIVLHSVTEYCIIMSPFFLFILSQHKSLSKWRFLNKKQNRNRMVTKKIIKQLKKKKTCIQPTIILKHYANQQRIYEKLRKCELKKPFVKTIKYSFNIIIPAFIVLRNQIAFFIVTTTLILFMIYFFIREFTLLSIKEKIFQSLIIFIFFLHHTCFLFMFVTQKLTLSVQNQMIKVCQIVGVIVIYTVICGGAIQLLKFIVQVLIGIKNKLAKLCKTQKQTNQSQSKKQATAHKQKSVFFRQKNLQLMRQKRQVEYVNVQKILKKTNSKTIKKSTGSSTHANPSANANANAGLSDKKQKSLYVKMHLSRQFMKTLSVNYNNK